MSGSKKRASLAKASVLIIIAGLLSKGLGFFREVVFADTFGLEPSFNIFLTGIVFPIIINTGIYHLSLNYFIPAWNRIKSEKGIDAAKVFFTTTFFLFSFTALLIALALYVFSEPLMQLYMPNADSVAFLTALNILRIYLITIPFQAALSIVSAYLHCDYKFTLPAYSQAIPNVLTILAVLLFAFEYGVYAIPIGFVGGTIIQAVVLLLVVLKVFGNKPSLGMIGVSNHLHILVLILFIELAGQSHILFDRFFYGSIIEGGIAALNYAMMVMVLPITILSIAFSTVLFPKFSELYYSGNKEELSRHLTGGLKINTLLFLPFMLIFITQGETIIQLIYERGKFTGSGTEVTFAALQIYAICIPFYAGFAILNKFLYGCDRIKTLLTISAISLVMKIIGNVILVDMYGYLGLALSTSIAFIVLFIGSLIVVRKMFNLKDYTKDFLLSGFNLLLTLTIIIVLRSGLPDTLAVDIVLAVLIPIVFGLNALLIKQDSIQRVLQVIRSS